VDLVEVLADVARALVRLHGAGHIHRDVKARNVLVRTAPNAAPFLPLSSAKPKTAQRTRGGTADVLMWYFL
jgi:serine/threonine-protein kinase 24/25/MST4